MCNVQSWKQCALRTVLTGKFTAWMFKIHTLPTQHILRGSQVVTTWLTYLTKQHWNDYCSHHTARKADSTAELCSTWSDHLTIDEFFIAVTCRPETNPMPAPLREPFQEKWYYAERTLQRLSVPQENLMCEISDVTTTRLPCFVFKHKRNMNLSASPTTPERTHRRKPCLWGPIPARLHLENWSIQAMAILQHIWSTSLNACCINSHFAPS